MYLDRLPLTPNGKIDRKALPEPDQSRQAIEVQFIAPRNELEKILAEIWTNVLKREVGVQDNFFDLGGHSLMATQLLSRIRSRLNREVPLRSLFETPTIEGLANLISTEELVRQRPAIKKRSRESVGTVSQKITELSGNGNRFNVK